MNAVIQAKDHFLTEFERAEPTLAGHGIAWLDKQRRAAMALIMERGLPGLRDEDWKYTRLTALEKRAFTLGAESHESISVDRLHEAMPVDLGGITLVFVNGRYYPALSRVESMPAGVEVASLASTLAQHPQKLQHMLGRCASLERHPFAALNTAFMQDGAYIHLAPRVTVSEPIHLVFVSTAAHSDHVVHPRVLVVAEEHSAAALVESHVALSEAVYFTNTLTEVMLGAHAMLDHYRIQEESVKAFHISGTHVQQGAHSRYSAQSISLGAALARNDVDVALNAPDAECTLNGLYMVSGRQHVDNHTRVDHLQPRGTSREFYKGVLDGSGRSVFNGKVVVHPDAQKTDAQQSNKNLILSADAEADTKPQLEIYADDVKCAHGATVGQLDQDAVFFLRARGIDEKDARGMLTYAFAGEIVAEIKNTVIQAHVKKQVIARLPISEQFKELL